MVISVGDSYITYFPRISSEVFIPVIYFHIPRVEADTQETYTWVERGHDLKSFSLLYPISGLPLDRPPCSEAE